MDLRAGIDSSGEIVAWEGELFMPEQRPANELIVPLLGARLADLPDDNDAGTGGISRNSNIPYKGCRAQLFSVPRFDDRKVVGRLTPTRAKLLPILDRLESWKRR